MSCTKRTLLTSLGSAAAFALVGPTTALAQAQRRVIINGELRAVSAARFAAAIRRHQDDVLYMSFNYPLQPVRSGLGVSVKEQQLHIITPSVYLVFPLLPSMVDARRRGEVIGMYTASYDRMESTKQRSFYMMTPYVGPTNRLSDAPTVSLGGSEHHID